MQYGIREICNVVFKAKNDMIVGSSTFKKGQPVLYIDTAKTSSLEGSADQTYAQGGRGNARLMSWEGNKTLTFTVEDALLSPIGFSILSGAGLFKSAEESVHVHKMIRTSVDSNGIIDLTEELASTEKIDGTAQVFCSIVEADGSVTGEIVSGLEVASDGKKLTGASTAKNRQVAIDFYITKESAKVNEVQIDAEHFGGYFYVEADTLFRDRDGKDYPAILTMPNVKIQSSFTFAMSADGDPSTFNFTMDCFPGYTYFNKNKKVMCVMQVVEDATSGNDIRESVMKHAAGFTIGEGAEDSLTADAIEG